MKKIGIINGPICAVIAHLEHSDTLTVADAGLPTPDTTQRIDRLRVQVIMDCVSGLESISSDR